MKRFPIVRTGRSSLNSIERGKEFFKNGYKKKEIMEFLVLFSAVFAVISIITFILYAVDKKRAQKGEWRIPEATLLCFSFLGGAIGGYAGMFAVRHKTKRWYFHAVNVLGLLWQSGLLVFLAFKAGGVA